MEGLLAEGILAGWKPVAVVVERACFDTADSQPHPTENVYLLHKKNLKNSLPSTFAEQLSILFNKSAND
jgi:hypothetical protein